MIDTICLLIPKHRITYLNLENRGVPRKWNLQSSTDQYEKFIKNPSNEDKDMGLYLPRLTGYKRKSFRQDDNIRIEFSVPKLLYLNNLDEVEDKDFSNVLDTLKDRLERMGLVIDKDLLANAPVSSVHFSKNIILEDGYTASHLISEMNKVNLNQSFDFAKTRYINDGQSLYAHTTSHQLVIYDKIADLEKGKKRAIDKDQTKYQQSLFEQVANKKELNEILRFEVRINHKQKLIGLLKKLGYTDKPTFKDVFNSELSKKIVNQYWQKLIKERSLGLFSISISLKDILRGLLSSNPKLKPNRAIYLTGLFILGRDGNGMRELRSIVSKRSHERTWKRIVKDIQGVSEMVAKDKLRDWVTQLDKKLEEYKPIKKQDLLCK